MSYNQKVDNNKDIRKVLQKEADNNFEAFKKQLDTIIEEHRNKYALMRDREIKEYFDTFNDAIRAGKVAFADKIYSVQKVENKNIELGYFSYA